MQLRYVIAALLLSASLGCGSYGGSPTTPTGGNNGGASGTPVSIVSGASVKTTTAYSPSPISVAVGGTVTWTNNDSTTHTATSNVFDSGAIAPGASFSYKFPAAGTYTYHCTIHPGMVGTVNVQ
jgi:plastocyanin